MARTVVPAGMKTSTASSKVRRSLGCMAPTPTTWRDTSWPRSSRTEIMTEYSQGSPTSGCWIVPFDTQRRDRGRFRAGPRRRACADPQMVAAHGTDGRTFENRLPAVRADTRCTGRALTRRGHDAEPLSTLRVDFLDAAEPALVAPPELDAAPHARARGDGERTRLEIAGENPRLEQFHPRGAADVAVELAAHRHRFGGHPADHLGSGFDGQIALHVHVALKAAGDADVARSLDLALDRESGGEDRLLEIRSPARGAAARTRRTEPGMTDRREVDPLIRLATDRRFHRRGTSSFLCAVGSFQIAMMQRVLVGVGCVRQFARARAVRLGVVTPHPERGAQLVIPGVGPLGTVDLRGIPRVRMCALAGATASPSRVRRSGIYPIPDPPTRHRVWFSNVRSAGGGD